MDLSPIHVIEALNCVAVELKSAVQALNALNATMRKLCMSQQYIAAGTPGPKPTPET